MDLYYRIQGQGRPVIILHGLFGDSLNWGGVSRILSDSYRLILPDQRNHGRSPHADDDCSYPTQAADIGRLMDRLELDSAHVIGHSMGGKVAMTLALASPERVDSLTVIDIAPKAYPPRHQDVFAGLQAVADQSPTSRRQADQILREHLPTDAIRTFILKNLARRDQGHFGWRLNWRALLTHYDQLTAFPDSASSYPGPVRFLLGGDSDYVSPDDQSHIASLFPAAKGHVIRGTGHWLHAEKPELVARRIQKFLDRVD